MHPILIVSKFLSARRQNKTSRNKLPNTNGAIYKTSVFVGIPPDGGIRKDVFLLSEHSIFHFTAVLNRYNCFEKACISQIFAGLLSSPITGGV